VVVVVIQSMTVNVVVVVRQVTRLYGAVSLIQVTLSML